jgi:hypothetical protein
MTFYIMCRERGGLSSLVSNTRIYVWCVVMCMIRPQWLRLLRGKMQYYL